MERGGYIYIMSNKNNTVLYTGVTSNLMNRVFEHKSGVYPDSFTHKYHVNKIVYYEVYSDIEEAIAREKQIKSGSRSKKIRLIESLNKEWKDLYKEIQDFD